MDVVAPSMGFKTHIHNYKMRVEGLATNKASHFSVILEVFEVAPSFFMVDIYKAAGDSIEFLKVRYRMTRVLVMRFGCAKRATELKFYIENPVNFETLEVRKLIQLISTFFGGFAIAFTREWRLAVVMLAFIPLFVVIGSIMAMLISKMSSCVQTAYAESRNVLVQTIGATRMVRIAKKTSVKFYYLQLN
ncbi:uncharacterized protein LOC122086268 [Macadamia integrifolia]|uniref:uncharacterized protein LOC122086268 n=1 Tax=Macadamia integrifolia TaxID=60698 RepID=UPI001C4EC594|nr:uncharacterized protein LOC122086268 [Macadamia integrifolia]XP_042510946.1 uncharacterized protein LOC122086268 [Macadamia integrifolia]